MSSAMPIFYDGHGLNSIKWVDNTGTHKVKEIIYSGTTIYKECIPKVTYTANSTFLKDKILMTFQNYRYDDNGVGGYYNVSTITANASGIVNYNSGENAYMNKGKIRFLFPDNEITPIKKIVQINSNGSEIVSWQDAGTINLESNIINSDINIIIEEKVEGVMIMPMSDIVTIKVVGINTAFFTRI